jgi:hypothetical protein
VTTPSRKTTSQLPASRFPAPAELYFCDNCGRDLTKKLYHDRAPVWQPLRPMWCVCPCGRKYLSGAAEWDDLTTWEREQRIRQLRIGFVLFALLVVPVTLAYFALRYRGAALLAVVGIALIPSILAAKPFGFILLDVYEIVASLWRTRASRRSASPAIAIKQRMLRFRTYRLWLVPAVTAIALLVMATRWTPSHLVAASPVGALSSPERSNPDQQETLFAPVELPSSLTRQPVAPGAPGPGFRRVRVGPNEVDFIAEDVTIRHFIPTPARSRAPRAYKEVHIGEDVTIRYFSSQPAIAPRTRPASPDPSLPLSQ